MPMSMNMSMSTPKPKTPTPTTTPRAAVMDAAEGVEPVELLDDYWFFQNLLRNKNRMVRSASDPYPSSNNMEQAFGRIEKNQSPKNGAGDSKKSRDELVMKKKSLQRTPSLPISIGSHRGVEEKAKGEKEVVRTRASSNKLRRQSSLCVPLVVPPRRAYKSSLTSPGIPKHHREPVMESTSTRKDIKPRIDVTKDTAPEITCPNNALKSPRELEIEEVQGFKDLGFDFSKLDLNPIVTSIVPGLQNKKPDDWDESKVRRPYLSEAWLTQSFTTVRPGCVMPDCLGLDSPANVKKQLRHWARVVATNVRQEC